MTMKQRKTQMSAKAEEKLKDLSTRKDSKGGPGGNPWDKVTDAANAAQRNYARRH